MFFKWKKKSKPESLKKEIVTLYADDDIISRARKIVFLLGFRGSVGDYEIIVARALFDYETIDKEKIEGKETPSRSITIYS